MKPILERISDWDSKTKMIYKCPKCEASFGFYFEDEHFCHNCGVKIDWHNIPIHCNKHFSDKYHGEKDYEKRQAMIDYVNYLIQNERKINDEK